MYEGQLQAGPVGETMGDELATVPWAETGSIGSKIESARRELLDLGLRNALLNYRLLRGRGVEVIGGAPPEVFRLLVGEGRKLSFLPAQEGSDGTVADESEAEVRGNGSRRRSESQLQTPVPRSQLEKRLLTTYYAARTFIEEQGINTLHIALGMLRWYEAKDSSQPRQAPLLLVPVELERSSARERFSVRYTGEDVGFNLSLHEKLKTEFGITLPPHPEFEDLDVGAYFEAVAEAIRSQQAWSVDRGAVVLGFFSFAKLLMFEDLDVDKWPEDQQPTDHPIIQAVLQDGFREPPSSYGEDDDLDKWAEPGQLHPVLDADSSQTLAILDVKAGRTMVIQGPPGTGKSQTIANVIAEALADGKSVLFVAEKMAALEVVKRRLDQVGLGDACLELHSNKTQKKLLLAELERALHLGKPRTPEAPGDRARLFQTRERLNEYCDAVNAPIEHSSVSPYRALGELVRLEQLHDQAAFQLISVGGMAAWDGAHFRHVEAQVAELQTRLKAAGVPRNHRYWGSKRTVLPPTDLQRLRESLQAAQDSITALATVSAELAQAVGGETPTRPSEIEPLLPPGWQFWRSWFGKDRPIRKKVQEAAEQHTACLGTLTQFLELDEDVVLGPGERLADQRFAVQLQIIATWLENPADLYTLVDFNHMAEECRANGLGPVVELASQWPRAADDLVTAFRYSWYRALLEIAYATRPALTSFHRESHEQALSEFRKLDALLARYNSALLAQKHWQQLPSLETGNGQLGVLRREFEKKTRHLPIRQLMVKAGGPIRAIKPVFMMSPLSIANYLPPGSLTFDLVIFDEASQVKPVDAFGALLRGKQAVVVGDKHQLPPTSFFDSLTKGDDIDEDNTTADMESILGLFAGQSAPDRMLRWHYRSRHESLIAVSNHAFYGDRLVVFPSPDAARERAGLIYHHLTESAYDRGGTRANHVEAQVVARAVMDHARSHPDLTLGVAAFSVSHMEAIQDELELLRRQDPTCEEFFESKHPHEPFFVKNLETVQGDERDVIFISVGYGRTKEGLLVQSFGPLNAAGGERRLNVLITRAKLRCEVFTNLTADDIVADGKGAGVRALKLFLAYAQTGRLDAPTAEDGEADSPFEEAVYYELTRRGYVVRKQVGSAGFRIDLAVLDPTHPGRYLLGIECDGATYHSARSARDRDRLRQHILEELGWTIHRIWSTDWFRNREGELQRLIGAIERAQEQTFTPQTGSEPPSPVSDEPLIREQAAPQPAKHVEGSSYQLASLRPMRLVGELHEADLVTLARLVTEVVAVESPVHISEVAHRIAESVGVRRVGNRIDAAIRRAAGYAARAGQISRRGDFLWTVSMSTPPVKDRSNLPGPSRKLTLVAPEEIEAAIERVVAEAYGIERAQIPPAVCRLFGFGRASEEMSLQIDGHIESMLRSARLAEQGGYINVASVEAAG